MMSFDCDRTCPLHELVDVCRFSKVFAKLGPSVVTSHTTTIKSEFKDHDILAGAVRGMGGKVLGMGTHKLYSESKTGFGFTIPGWSYPIIAEANGSLAFDNFNNRWGDVADLERLKDEYVISTAEMAAISQGWAVQREGSSLTIFHPTGGHMVVGANGAEAFGFVGGSCHDALTALNLPISQWQAKPEFSQVAAEIQTQS